MSISCNISPSASEGGFVPRICAKVLFWNGKLIIFANGFCDILSNSSADCYVFTGSFPYAYKSDKLNKVIATITIFFEIIIIFIYLIFCFFFSI